MKKCLLSIVSIVYLCAVQAQESSYFSGVVKDQATGQTLTGVNIYNQNSNDGTFSDANGAFRLKIAQYPCTIIFSYIGYENNLVTLENPSDQVMTIRLKPSPLLLPDVEVLAEPKVEKLSEARYTIKDFVISNDRIVLIKFGGLSVGHFLELTDLEGQVLHSIKVKAKGTIQSLHQSCLGHIHLVCSKEAIELSIKDDKVVMVSKYPRVSFEQLLEPCVASSEDYVYFRYSKHLDQQLNYDCIDRKNQSVSNTITVTDYENLRRAREELGGAAYAESYYSITNIEDYNPFSTLTRPEEFDAWQNLFFKPLFSPLYNLGTELCLFNHTRSFIGFYSLDGKIQRVLPITYHQETHWDKQILKDAIQNRFYTSYTNAKGKRFYEIDLKKGTIEPAFKVQTDFAEKMVIHNGYLYYKDSKIQRGETNRILHRVRVN